MIAASRLWRPLLLFYFFLLIDNVLDIIGVFEVYMLNAKDQMPDFPQEPYPTFEVRCWALMIDLNLNLILVYCDLLKPTFARRTRSGPTKSGKNGWAIWGSRWVTAGNTK